LPTEVAILKLIEDHRPELDDLCRRQHVSRLELFGSAVSSLEIRLARSKP
jgi:hypothetical protein